MNILALETRPSTTLPTNMAALLRTAITIIEVKA
jgi:hypothetical protein